MHRLLQGDVGAGKTLVAVHALLVAVQNGHQGILMAPTEVLAEQHAIGVTALLDGLEVDDASNLFGGRPVRIELLTNRVTGAERKDVLDGLANGEVDIAIVKCVRPWNAPSKTTMFGRAVVWRATLTADSITSSADVVKKNDSIPSGVISASRSASGSSRSWVYTLFGAWTHRSA